MPRGAALLTVLLIGAFALRAADAPKRTPGRANTAVVVTVNGRPITAAELELHLALRRIPEERRDEARAELLEELIDRELVRSFLDARKVEIPREDLDGPLARIDEQLREAGEDPDAVLARLGATREQLAEAIALPLRWQRYVRLAVTPARLREHFEAHKSRFDGTRLRTSQILIKVPAGENADTATAQLETVREQIVSGKLTFAEAARQYSEAPSAEDGGDMGFSRHRDGRMPPALSDAAFDPGLGQVSPPVRTSLGVHLLTVTEVKPGDLSLEDARPRVLEALARELWDETVARERETAKIERMDGA